MSLICTRKRMGPRTDPWGTPETTLPKGDQVLYHLLQPFALQLQLLQKWKERNEEQDFVWSNQLYSSDWKAQRSGIWYQRSLVITYVAGPEQKLWGKSGTCRKSSSICGTYVPDLAGYSVLISVRSWTWKFGFFPDPEQDRNAEKCQIRHNHNCSIKHRFF